MVLPEIHSFISREDIEHVTLCIEVLFGLGWRNTPDGAEQTSAVEPIDPSERGHFQLVHVAPWTLAVDQFGFVETIYSFSEGVVAGIPDAAHRWFNACFGQMLGIENGLCFTKRLGDSLCESSMIARGHEQLVTHTGAMVNSGVYGRFHAAVVSGWGCLMPSLKLMPSMTSAR